MNSIILDRHESDPLGSSSTQFCSFYFDGFNLYHSIVDLLDYNNKSLLINPIENLDQMKWCDLRKLCQFLIRNNNFLTIRDIYFFTAIPTHRPIEQIKRHNNYSQVLNQYSNIKVINGKFSHGKEKQTDVNLAVQVISDVLLKKVNTIFIISNDSDIIPIINKLKEIGGQTNINIVKPPSAKYLMKKKDDSTSIYETTRLSFDIKKAMDFYYDNGFNRIRELKPQHLLNCLLPDTI